ncbi:hypothetical protein HQQ81_09020 [Microbacteriaceae bacterium VKM Ac-2854]|nr:hypothetical protein [Microbacteriaceae bacterium VKM Ac-2854]
MERRRLLVVVSAAIAAVLVAAAITLDLLGRDDGPPPPAAATLDPSPGAAGPSTTAATAPPTATTPATVPSAAAEPSSAPSSEPTAAPGAAAEGPDPARPLEVTGPAPESTGLPPSAPRPALVTLPLPPAASAEGSVVAGFPTAVVPVLDGARIASTSIAGDGSVLRAGLVADGARAADSVLDFYRAVLSPLGFTSAELPGNEGGTAMEFSRGADSVSVSIDPERNGRTGYSVFAVLHAE